MAIKSINYQQEYLLLRPNQISRLQAPSSGNLNSNQGSGRARLTLAEQPSNWQHFPQFKFKIMSAASAHHSTQAASSVQEQFAYAEPISKEMPSFIKSGASAPASSQASGASSGVKKSPIALDSLEPVIVSGVSSTGPSSTGNGTIANNPSPQNFGASNKGLDLLQGADIQSPRGDPAYVGLAKLTYAASSLKLANGGNFEICQIEDFTESFIEKTLPYYYKGGAKSSSSPTKDAADVESGGSPERTGNKRSDQTGPGAPQEGVLSPKEEIKMTRQLLQQAKRTPYEFCKVSFSIDLPFEMMVEQVQIVLPTSEASDQSNDLTSLEHLNQAQPVGPSQRRPSNKAAMNIVSSNPSKVASKLSAPDCSFGQHFKILNIASCRQSELSQINASTDSKRVQASPSKAKQRLAKEHRHLTVKSAFSEEVTGKHAIEINVCGVTRHLHVSLLCLRQDVAHFFGRKGSISSERKSKASGVGAPFEKAHAQEQMTGAQKVIAEIEGTNIDDFDLLDEHDREVALISKNHLGMDVEEEEDGAGEGIIDHEQIAMQLRGDEDDFDRDMYDEDLGQFKVGSIINNDEDDLRILASLPQMHRPKNLHNSFASRKQTSGKKHKSGAKNADEGSSGQQRAAGSPLARFIDKIVVFGFNCNAIPAITNLTYFMNQAFYMRKQKKHHQAEEIDFMVGMLLISTKRATQAAEFFRKSQCQIMKKIQRNLSKLEKQARVSEECSSNATFALEHEVKTETQNWFIQCAIIELLIADALSFETQLNEKIQALTRLVVFTQGQLPPMIRFAPQILVADDSFSALLRILPGLLRFCILCLTHRREIVRISALKILKFILETQGCSLDSSMIFILKGMFMTFPKPIREQQPGGAAGDKDPDKTQKVGSSFEDSPSAKSASTMKGPKEADSSNPLKSSAQSNKVKVVNNDFDLAQLLGESEAATVTVNEFIFYGQNRSPLLSMSTNHAIHAQNQSDSAVIVSEPEAALYATPYAAIQEPASGFSTALANIYSHVLETYISVLSSISSHILHSIFYDVIELTLVPNAAPSLADTSKISPHNKASASFKHQQSMSARDTSKLLPQRCNLSQTNQIKVYACKIAEKIITICQGDLNISHNLLTTLVDTYSAQKPPSQPYDQSSQQAHASMKNLWLSIRQKVFPNYSTKGYRKLVEWINAKMSSLITTPKTLPQDLLNTKPAKMRANAFPDELSDEESATLCQLCDIITIVSMGRLKTEEEANQLIKLPPAESFGNGASAEMYLLLAQLIFWLEYSIDREDRLQLFSQLYQTIKDCLESIPTNGRTKEHQLNVLQIVMPSLRRTNEFFKSNSPSLPMLKFLDIVLSDVYLMALERKSKATAQQQTHSNPVSTASKQGGASGNLPMDPIRLLPFFLELLDNFLTSLAYSLYEEAFPVLDKLIFLAGDSLSDSVIKKCIVALVDKYTLKSKSHKTSLTNFMKSLLDVKVKKNMSPNMSWQHARNKSNPGSPEIEELVNETDLSAMNQHSSATYFEVMTEFCFFDNVDTAYKYVSRMGQTRVIDDRTEYNSVGMAQLDFRGPMDMHELFIDRLQFFIDSLSMLTDVHIGMFTTLITHPNFKNMLLQILEHGETNVRMKSHEILEALTSYFVQYCPSKTVYEFADRNRDAGLHGSLAGGPAAGHNKNDFMDAEFISHERLYISQIVIQVAKKSLQQTHDCYLQFNALILLDFLFQNLLPVPTFVNEQVKARKQNKGAQSPTGADATDVELTMDIEALSISEMTPELDVMDPAYLRMRMKLVLSLWPHIQNALSSPWSNIRSICYGLVCSMLKINVADYPMTDHQALSREIGNTGGQPGGALNPNMQFSNDKRNNLSEIIGDHQAALSEDRKDQLILSDIMSMNAATQSRLKEIILPMLYNLLSSKESESKAGGLNILGSFCGLSYDFTDVKIHQNLAFLQRNSAFVGLPIWRLVYQLQDDWDITIKEASVVLVQLCAPRNAILYFHSLKEKRQQKKLQYMMNSMANIQHIYYNPAAGCQLSDDEEPEEVRRVRSGLRPQSRLKIKDYLVARNEHAARAYSQFPTETDLEVILGKNAAVGLTQKINNEEARGGKLRFMGGNSGDKPDEASFSILQESTLINDAFGEQFGNFSDYLCGKVPLMTPQNLAGGPNQEFLFAQQTVSHQMIEQEHLILVDKVHAFNPDYEDTRFSKNLSRKRQLEIELDMPSRGKKHNANAMNFFVDAYSDEQIQEIISIFRNDFKPPKNLWIEKQPSPQTLGSGGMSHGAQLSLAQQPNMRSQSPDYYQDIYAEAIEQFNQQQQAMQQQQQAQLQQQVQNGSSPSPDSSSSTSSAQSAQSAPSVPGQPVVAPISGAEPQGAARLSPQQTAGRMMDALEDDQLRKYEEEHQAKQKSVHSSSQGSAHSRKSSAHHTSSKGSPDGGGSAGSASPARSRKMSNEVQAFSPTDFTELQQKVPSMHSQSQESRNMSRDKHSQGKKMSTEEMQHLQDHSQDGPQVSPPGYDVAGYEEQGDQPFLDNLQMDEVQKPMKSESMGLLDAEGYKFLNDSDSNSAHYRDQEHMQLAAHDAEHAIQIYQDMEDLPVDEIYEMCPPKPSNKSQQTSSSAGMAAQYGRPPVQGFKQGTLKIEQLNFDNIQICANTQPNNLSRTQVLNLTKPGLSQGPKTTADGKVYAQQANRNLKAAPGVLSQNQAQGGARIEFYRDPEVNQQNSSRLGQRSSRLHYQEELEKYARQNQFDEVKQGPRGSGGPAAFNKVKSPTDKIAGVRHSYKHSFGGSSNADPIIQLQVNQGGVANDKENRKSTESRKRKRSQQSTSKGPKKKHQHLQLIENDYFSQDDKHLTHLKNHTQRVTHGATVSFGGLNFQLGASKGQATTRHKSKSIGSSNSVSTPDFNMLQNKLNQMYSQQKSNENGVGASDADGAGQAGDGNEQSKISRKMAQTYLSGLSKGYINNLNSLKLINNCLVGGPGTTANDSQQQQSTTAGSSRVNGISSGAKAASSLLLNKSNGSGCGTQIIANSVTSSTAKQSGAKKINKSFENLGAHQMKLNVKQQSNNGSMLIDLQLQNPKMTYQTHRSNKDGKNSTLSSSPKRRDGSQTTANHNSAGHQRKQKSVDKSFGFTRKHKQQQNQGSSDSKGIGVVPGTTTSAGSSKKVNNLAELNLFIKSIEKELSEKFRNMRDLNVKGPATPNQILRKVEDQMRAFGLDPKSGSNQATAQALVRKFTGDQHWTNSTSQEKKKKKSLPPKLKLLGLNQMQSQGTKRAGQGLKATLGGTQEFTNLFNQNITPSNVSSNGSGSHLLITNSHLNIHKGINAASHVLQGPSHAYMGSSPGKHETDSLYSGVRQSRKRSGPRDRSAESRTSRQRTRSGRLSTGRGASSGSGGRTGAISHQIPNPPMVMTERHSMRPARPATGNKQQSSGHTKNSKSMTKGGGSALAKPNKASSAKGATSNIPTSTFTPATHQSQMQQVLSSFQGNSTQATSGLASEKPSKSKIQKLNKSLNKAHPR